LVLSARIFISKVLFVSKSDLSSKDLYLILSKASEAFEMSSLKKNIFITIKSIDD